LFRKNYYNLPDNQEGPPTRGQKAKAALREMFKAITQGGYQQPEQRFRAYAEKEFPEETQRLNTLSPLIHYQTQLQIANDKLNKSYEDLAEKTKNHEALLDFYKTKEKDQADARSLRNSILLLNVQSLAGVRSKEAALLEQKTLVQKFLA